MKHSRVPEAYRTLVKDLAWSPRDRFGVAAASTDPLEVLRAAATPESVIAAVKLAIDSDCTVRFESYACHIGGWESVVVLEPVPENVRASLDAIDASGMKDGASMPRWRASRWWDGKNRTDGRGHWEWTTEGD